MVYIFNTQIATISRDRELEEKLLELEKYLAYKYSDQIIESWYFDGFRSMLQKKMELMNEDNY